jgi:DNA-binding GntR family transcriptional regulator
MINFIVGNSMPGTDAFEYKTLTELVVERLRNKIIAGDIKPGERINQETLASEFKTSKSPIREALFLLKAEGFITMQSNKGAMVSMINTDQIDELFSLKILLETDLLASSLPHILDEKLEEARTILDQLQSVTSASLWCELNKQYYNCLYSGTKRPQTQEMLTILSTKIERYNYIHFTRIKDKESEHSNIHKLLSYCSQRKISSAIEQLRLHILSYRDEIKLLLQ